MRESPVSPSLSATALLTEQISAAPVAANGGSAVSPSTTEPRQAPPAHALPSHVSYQIRMQTDARGLCVPIELGVGNFARVLRGVQLNAGQDVRAVAIKILHPNATYADELLFRHEIDLLRSLSDADSVNVIRALDVLQLGPMILCGCGTIYEPLCPMGSSGKGGSSDTRKTRQSSRRRSSRRRLLRRKKPKRHERKQSRPRRRRKTSTIS